MNITTGYQVCSFVLIVTCLVCVEPKRCRKADEKKGRRCQEKRNGKTASKPQQMAPYWRRGPPKESKIIVREGSDVSLNCPIKGKPFPEFSWLRNTKSLNPNASDKYRQRRSRLWISSIQISDMATYTCIAKNKLGHLNFTYNIQVLENMPLKDIDVVDEPENQTAHVGDTVIFLCRSEDWPKPQVHWIRVTDSRKIMEVIQTASNRSDELVIHNVTKLDSGEYTCYISNDVVRKQLSARLMVIREDETLPFEPPCSLHVRREHYEDKLTGCKTSQPLEMHYCMGSCGRSYDIPQLMLSDNEVFASPPTSMKEPCKCCQGVVSDLRIVHLECPLGQTKRAFYTLLRDCVCQICGTKVKNATIN